MEEKKDDEYYVKRIVEYIEFAIEYSNSMKKKNKNMKPNDQDSDGVVYKICQIREEIKNLSEEYINNHTELHEHLKKLIGFRNRLIHDYANVSYDYFDEILDLNLPELKTLLEHSIGIYKDYDCFIECQKEKD